MKMFNMIDIGERAGSGVPELFTVWEQESWEEPQIEEQMDGVERTIVILSFKQRMPKKSIEKKITEKTRIQYERILSFMEPGEWYRASELENILDVRERRMRTLLGELTEARLLEDNGVTKGRRYRKPKKKNH